jgi:hypothetical protein
MEAMRKRMLAAVAGLGLLAALVGCHHTAGCCDCENEGYGCCFEGCGGYRNHHGGIPGNGHVISTAPVAAPVAPPAAPPDTKPGDGDKPVDKIPATAPKTDDTTNKDKE